MSEADAQFFLPPDATVKKSFSDNRWRVAWHVYRISRCWSLYGELEAFFMCAAYLWHSYTEVTEIACPFDFLKDVTWE